VGETPCTLVCRSSRIQTSLAISCELKSGSNHIEVRSSALLGVIHLPPLAFCVHWLGHAKSFMFRHLEFLTKLPFGRQPSEAQPPEPIGPSTTFRKQNNYATAHPDVLSLSSGRPECLADVRFWADRLPCLPPSCTSRPRLWLAAPCFVR
jgi:hypothetical protein